MTESVKFKPQRGKLYWTESQKRNFELRYSRNGWKGCKVAWHTTDTILRNNETMHILVQFIAEFHGVFIIKTE